MNTNLPPAPTVAKKSAKKSTKASKRASSKEATGQVFPTAEELDYVGGLADGTLKLTVVDPNPELDYRYIVDDPSSVQQRTQQQHYQIVQNDHNPASDIDSSLTQFHSGTNAQGGAQKLILVARHKSLQVRSDESKRVQRGLNEAALDPSKQPGVTEEDKGSLFSKLERSRS